MNVNLDIARIRNDRAGRVSSWDTTGRNNDAWIIPAGESRVLANIEGPGVITHIWMTQAMGYREVLLRFYWDGARFPSVNVPLGDFFGLGHSIVNSYQIVAVQCVNGGQRPVEPGLCVELLRADAVQEICTR